VNDVFLRFRFRGCAENIGELPNSAFRTRMKRGTNEAMLTAAGRLQIALAELENLKAAGFQLAETTEADLKAAIEKAEKEIPESLEAGGARIGFTFAFFSKAYLSRLAFVIFCLLLTGYLNALSSTIAGYRNPRITITAPTWAAKTTTLPDIGHDIIGAITKRTIGKDYIDWFELPDMFVSAMGTAMGLFIATHPKRFVIARRLGIIFATLNGIRCFTVISTTLPDASPECAKQFDSPDGAYKERSMEMAIYASIRRALSLAMNPGDHITCGESHHATYMLSTRALNDQIGLVFL